MCYVQVFDSFGVYTEATDVVIVSKQLNQQLLQNSLLNALHASVGNVDATKSALVRASAVLNQVSCAKAPSCDHLHRFECSKVADTCGVCKAGFIGDAGNANSACVYVNIKTYSSSGSNGKSGCSRDADCALFESCHVPSKQCLLPSKTCLNDCSYQGECYSININTRLNVKDCKVTDVTCQAKCSCSGNFTGSDCSTNKVILLQKQALRTEMLTGLATVVSTNTDGGFSADSLGSLSDMLSSLTSNVYEVSPKMVNTISQVAYSVLSSATKSNITVSYDSLSGLLSSVNTVIQLSNANARSAEVLNLFCDLITSQLVSGENDVNYVYDEFRMKVVSTSLTQGTSLQIVAPQTVMESTFNSQSASSITIQQHSDQKALAGGRNSMVDMSISMLITTASSYGSLATKMNNNPVQVKLSSRGDQPTEIVLTMTHNADKQFTNASQAAEMGFNTTCHGPQDHSTYNYTCHDSHEVLVHSCNGRRGVLTSYCTILAPKCALIDSNSGDIDANSSVCSVVDYSKSNTVCRCLIQPLRSQRRLNNNFAMDGVLNVVSTSVFVANNFKNTFSSAGDMNSVADLQRVLIVIVMFSVMWASGLLLIFSCIWRRKYMIKMNVLEQQLLERNARVQSC
jgi:hypothetical protein